MANKKAITVPVNKERFMKVLDECDSSIRGLGDVFEIGRTEKTIRRCLNQGQMSPELLTRIAKHLGVHPDYLSGSMDAKAVKMNPVIKKMYLSSLTADNNPYVLKIKSDIDYDEHFEEMLARDNVTMEQFRTLDPVDRVIFRQKIDLAISEVISEYIKKDALGYDMEEKVEYLSAYVEDFDPTSYYALLEGVGIPPEEIEFPNWEEESEEEKRLRKKWGIVDE